MSGYVVTNEMAGSLQNLSSTYKTLVRLAQAATLMKRARTFELEVSANNVPNATDCAVQVNYEYCDATGGAAAANGTSTSATAQPLDAGTSITNIDVAVTLGRVNFSAEPTTYIAANTFWSRAFNQRSGVLWQAAPGREIYTPAAASVGPGIQAKSTNYASTALAKILFDEI
jgi:hypothetical protein